MNYLDNYLNSLRARGQNALADTVSQTVGEFNERFLNNFDYCSNQAALLFGNVQSGKTGQMLGIIAAAADTGFSYFVLLTTDNVVLQSQTLERVRRELPDFCVCDEGEGTLIETTNGTKPAVIVLKKNQKTLRHWEKVLRTSRVLTGNPLFILDDEADASSLNTKVNQDDVSRINELLTKIRSNASCTVFLQVTGTPQAIFLQTEASEWQPACTLYFEPGKAYLGGDFFFPEQAVAPNCIGFIDDDEDSVRTFVARHLAVTAVRFARGAAASNAVVHNSTLKARHEDLMTKVKTVLSNMTAAPSLLRSLVEPHLQDIARQSVAPLGIGPCLKAIQTSILPTVRTFIINSENAFDRSEIESGCNFIAGGNSLGRGVTFPALNTFLYTRTAKNPQADTVWQHNRIFGYDRDRSLIKVYLPRHLYKLLCDISTANNAVIAQVKSGLKGIKLCYPKNLRPTRQNVLDKKALNLIPGGKNFYPDDLENKTIDAIDSLLAGYGNAGYSLAPLALAKELLSCIKSLDDGFSTESYQSIFDAMLSQDPSQKCALIVRRSRNISQGTGALLSPDDWALGNSLTDVPVLTLYRVTGEKGWGGKPLWVPNIRLPDNGVYYGISG